MSEYQLYRRQVEVAPKLANGNLCLNWDMRLGKTRACLNAFWKIANAGGPRTAIVVCPSIAKGVWLEENIEMGLELPALKLDGITQKRSSGQLIEGVPQLYVVNWEIVDAHLIELMELAKRKRIVLILDETQDHCCNPANARYKAVRDLALVCELTWICTGTLYRTSAMDLHWQLRLLGPEAYPFYYLKTKDFGERFTYPRYNKFKKGFEYRGLKAGTEKTLMGIPCIDRRLEELDELPGEVVWWLDEGDKWEYKGGEQEGAMARARSELSELKAERTVELIRRNNLHLEQLVVFGWHKRFIHKVAAELAAAVIDGDTPQERKDQIKHDFASGRIRIVVANIKSAGVAIDLASARNAIFGEIDWVAATMAQAEARIRGPKQLRQVCYWYALAKNSVDEFVWRSMLGRGRDMNRLDNSRIAV